MRRRPTEAQVELMKAHGLSFCAFLWDSVDHSGVGRGCQALSLKLEGQAEAEDVLEG